MSHAISYTLSGVHYAVESLSMTATSVSGTRHSYEQAADAEAGVPPLKSEAFSFPVDAALPEAQALLAALSTKLQGVGDVAGDERRKARERYAKDKEEKATRKAAQEKVQADAAKSVDALKAAQAQAQAARTS